MELTLSVVSYHRFTSDLETKKKFVRNEQSHFYSIGRAGQCDWCLPDPERVISGKHALIESHAGGFSVIDLSTNGLFINRSVEPLGKNNSQVLSDGDIIALGDYEVEVSLNNSTLSQGEQYNSINSANEDNETYAGSDDDWQFGIPTTPSGQSKIIDKPVDIATQKVVSNNSEPVFIGNIEDSFAPPASESTVSDAFEELTIPEDWSAILDSVSYDEKEDIDVRQNTENAVLGSEIHPVESAVETSLPLGSSGLSGDSSSVAEAFIRGLGIDPSMVPEGSDEQWWFELGVAMQHLMTGLMDTLHHRSAFKHNNRLNQTLFKRQENNPLKFSATVEDAIHNLFNRNSSSFLSADRAIKEAYSDIEKHEQALLAGVEGTVAGIMKLLSPASITGRSTEQKIWRLLSPARSKAAHWDTYTALYQRLEQDLEGANKAFYLDDFVKAYETSLKGIK